jgi:hypothetical protein
MSKTATAPTTIAELKAEARTKWNRWAIQLADNGTMPAPRDLLDSGIVLGFESPADALERDAKIIQAARTRQAEIAAAEQRIAAWEAETGGHAVLKRLVEELQDQLDRAEAMRSGNMLNIQCRGVAERELSALRRQYPDLLDGIR